MAPARVAEHTFPSVVISIIIFITIRQVQLIIGLKKDPSDERYQKNKLIIFSGSAYGSNFFVFQYFFIKFSLRSKLVLIPSFPGSFYHSIIFSTPSGHSSKNSRYIFGTIYMI